MSTYTKTTVANNPTTEPSITVYKRLATTGVPRDSSAALGKISIDAAISNTTDYSATYTWSLRHLIANSSSTANAPSSPIATWVPMVVGTAETTPVATDTASNFLVSNLVTAAIPSKLVLGFNAKNTATTTWQSFTGVTGRLPMLGSEATIKVVIAWKDKYGGTMSGSVSKYFRFEFPTEMQAGDPSWTFTITDITNSASHVNVDTDVLSV